MARNHSSLSFRNRLGIGLVAMATIGVGCAVDDPNVDGNIFVDLSLQGGGGGGDPGIPNHLQPRCLMDHGVQKAVRNLGDAALVSSGISAFGPELPSMPSMPAGDATGDVENCRRTFLQILVECAFGDDQSATDLADPYDNVTIYTPRKYFGAIGLAPDWETGALTTSEEELVTACVMARTNRFGKTVMVGLQGPHFPSDPDEVDAWYGYRESTVWGNMFASQVDLHPEDNTASPPPFAAHVCEDYDIGRCPEEILRVCDASSLPGRYGVNDCGFISHGPCVNTGLACSGLNGTPPAYCTGFDYKISASLQEDGALCPYNIGMPTPYTYAEVAGP